MLMYLPLGSMIFLIILQSNPFLKSIATPLELLLPCASSKGAPHSAFHCFSLLTVECVSCRKIICAFCFLHHAKIARRFFKIAQTSYIERKHSKITHSYHYFSNLGNGKDMEDRWRYNIPLNS